MKNKKFIRYFTFCLTLLLVLSAVATALPAMAVVDPVKQMATEDEWEILKETNTARVAAGVEPLSMFSSLQNAAHLRAEELKTRMSHTRPNDTSYSTVFADKNVELPKNSATIGENIGGVEMKYEIFEISDIMNAWMNSEGHRANILRSSFSHLGAGVLIDNLGEGEQKGYFTQNFTGGCQATKLEILGLPSSYLSVAPNSMPADWDLVVCVTCTCGVKSYLPLMNALCTDYDPDTFGAQTVKVSYRGQSTTIPVTIGFSDIRPNDWFFTPIYRAVDAGLFNGVTETEFAPENNMTRGMLVTVLYRLEGCPAVSSHSGFTDVANDQYYSEPVTWAATNNIVNGIGDNCFAPNNSISRQEIATILYRYVLYKNGNTDDRADISAFTDWNTTDTYAQDAIRWCFANGYICSMSPTILSPKSGATRAQVATILIRYLDSITG